MFFSRFFLQKNREKRIAVFALIAGMTALSACSMKEGESSGVFLLKDGKVSATIVESFDKNYYNAEELQQMILEESSSYNRSVGQGAIAVEKVSVEEGTVNVKMSYASAKDYAAFNEGIFYAGTVQDAVAAGYDMNKVLISVEDALATIGMSDILAMTDMKILITDMKEPVTLDGKAAYLSTNATVDKKLKTVSFDKASEGLAYILYKQ